MATVTNTVFFGTRAGEIDAHGRVVFPAEWRQKLGGNFIITRGIEPCLYVFPFSKFRLIASAIDKLGLELSDSRKWGRYLSSMASETSIDSNGYVSMPAGLKNFAGLTTTVVLVGVVDHIEIWDEQRYSASVSAWETEITDVVERIGKLKQERVN